MAGKEIDATAASATAAATDAGLKNGASYLAIQMMIDAYPDGAKQKNDAGDLPLHVALKNKAEWKCVRACLEAFPDGAKQPNE